VNPQPDAVELARLRADLEAAALPDSCVLQTVTLTSDGQGGQTEAWAAAGTVACRLDNGSGQRANVAASVRPFSSWVLTVPYGTGLTTAYRVEHGGETYAVIAVSDSGSWLACERAHLERI
jgi:SPP1 family predicted phage head-tail adaptor